MAAIGDGAEESAVAQRRRKKPFRPHVILHSRLKILNGVYYTLFATLVPPSAFHLHRTESSAESDIGQLQSIVFNRAEFLYG